MTAIPIWSLVLLIAIIAIWDIVWKIFAMWKAAKKNSFVWFVCLLIFNTVGILPILYIYVFSDMEMKKENKKKSSKKKSPRKK